MSQAQLLPTASFPASLPPITYKGMPVVTTEMLAKAYGCTVKNIQMNFSNNRERFTEGKHFFILTNGEVKAFRDCTKSFGSVVPARTRNLTLWLERGAARHAKMLNTDRAWDVFEMLEETFFRVVKPTAEAVMLNPPKPYCTDREMRPLHVAINEWCRRKGVKRLDALEMVREHFGLNRFRPWPKDLYNDALSWIREQYAPKEPDLSNLPNARQLLRDIDQAIMVLAPTENWTHLMVREELRREAAPVPRTQSTCTSTPHGMLWGLLAPHSWQLWRWVKWGSVAHFGATTGATATMT